MSLIAPALPRHSVHATAIFAIGELVGNATLTDGFEATP